MRALPFGAIRSVHLFLRQSLALQWLGSVSLSLLCCAFFGDFICISTEGLAASTDATVKTFFMLLGWQLSAADDSKSLDFAAVFECLGIVVSLKDSERCLFSFENTIKKLEELKAELTSIATRKELGQAQALRLRGRTQFAGSSLFGRSARKRSLTRLLDLAASSLRPVWRRLEISCLLFSPTNPRCWIFATCARGSCTQMRVLKALIRAKRPVASEVSLLMRQAVNSNIFLPIDVGRRGALWLGRRSCHL